MLKKNQWSWLLAKEFTACSYPWGLGWKQWVEVMMHFNKCAWKYILHWHWLWPWALDHWCSDTFVSTVPKAASFKHDWAKSLGLSLLPLSIVLVPCHPRFRKRNSLPFSFHPIYSRGHQDCPIKVYFSNPWCFFIEIRYYNFSRNPYK